MNNVKGQLIIISGPSGVGKGTVLAEYKKTAENVRVSVSATTRSPRFDEENGVHYFFMSREQFEKNIADGGMLEWAKYNNNYYGTPKANVERLLEEGFDVILEIDVQGALKVKAVYPEAVLIFIMPPSIDTLRLRLSGRGTEDEETIKNRLEAAVKEFTFAGEYDFIIVNDELEKAVESLKTAIDASRYLVKCNQKYISEVNKNAQTGCITK